MNIFAKLGLFIPLILGIYGLPAAARSLAEINKTKELRICIAPTSSGIASASPEGCRDNCKFSGRVYEEALEFAHSLGRDIKPKFLRVTWDEQFHNSKGQTVRDDSYTPELLAAGQCDFYPSSLSINEWRLKKMDFALLHINRMMVIARKDKKNQFKTVADLAGKSAAVTLNSSYHGWLQKMNAGEFQKNPVKIIFKEEADEIFRLIEAGDIDFTVQDAYLAIYATKNSFKKSAVMMPVGPLDEIGWAFRKQDADLRAAAELFFSKQLGKPDGALNLIWEKNFGLSIDKFIVLMR
ncbi:substrate-binding periplasmic protein [Roseateles albus]|uniref:ABC transporter substrate-binding protein n=1 Tax=Roseateles albus TaxID=2987525 RepID=A0ABT5KBC0_9BURK|nr:ABC transporter substrate-binding protein [Roseateles albus]MDC8771236.1 ABC transporter substrate-binding protein [Roseateles albus]